MAAAIVPDMDERRYNTGVFRDPQNYNNSNNVIIAGGGIVCIAAKEGEGGKRTVHLRNRKHVELEMAPAYWIRS
jgi:hypothetical protein